jgi:hypothetical protein
MNASFTRCSHDRQRPLAEATAGWEAMEMDQTYAVVETSAKPPQILVLIDDANEAEAIAAELRHGGRKVVTAPYRAA